MPLTAPLAEPEACRGRRGAGTPRGRWAPTGMLIVAGLLAAGGATTPLAAAPTAVRAWREDPRPPSEAPLDLEPLPGRRWSWRAQRRVQRRRAAAERLLDRGEEGNEPETAESMTGDDTTRGAGLTVRDQPYASPDREGRRRFDISLPGRCPETIPAVVWIHGDGWRDGSRADCPVRWLALEGYAVASIGYRTSDVARFPAQLDDVRAAIAEIVRRADEWGIDPERIAVVGAGGGGLLAALAGLTDGAEAEAGGAEEAGWGRPLPAVVALVSAPTNLPTLGPEHDRPRSPASLLVGGPLPEVREAALAASPVTHVSPDDPPCLIVHGSADRSVPLDQALRLDGALRGVGVPSTLVILEGSGHSISLERGTEAARALLDFLDSHLRGETAHLMPAEIPGDASATP